MRVFCLVLLLFGISTAQADLPEKEKGEAAAIEMFEGFYPDMQIEMLSFALSFYYSDLLEDSSVCPSEKERFEQQLDAAQQEDETKPTSKHLYLALIELKALSFCLKWAAHDEW